MHTPLPATLVAALIAAASPAQAVEAPAVAAPSAETKQRRDVAFDVFRSEFIEALLSQNPDWALEVGDYRHAGRLEIPSPKSRALQRQFATRWLARLGQHPAQHLSAANRVDHLLITKHLQQTRWALDSFREWSWNPALFNVAEGIALLLSRDFATPEERLLKIGERLDQVPAYYAAARSSIQRPTLEHTRLAILQSQGTLDLLGAQLTEAVARSRLDDAGKAALLGKAALARRSVQDWIDWLSELQTRLERGGARSFRIGPALYAQKFGFEIQTDMTPTQLYRAAVAEKEKLHARMDELARSLWPKYFPDQPLPEDRLQRIGRLIDRLSQEHVSAEGFVDEVKRQIPLLEAWVREHDLLTLDPSRPLLVRETPAHKRGVAGASIDAPGPFDPAATTWYNVTSPTSLPPDQQESTLREYNRWMLQILNIHEAVPGHYVQLVYANRSPSQVKSLLGNGAMIEGWAVYAERMMLESGWGGNEPELWFVYAKWALRVACNTILDYSVHNRAMSEKDAIHLLRDEAFQEEAEAREKWQRATLTQVQLTSYYSGFASIYALREELRRTQGDAFSLKRFHEQFLGYGSAPVKYIARMMRNSSGR